MTNTSFTFHTLFQLRFILIDRLHIFVVPFKDISLVEGRRCLTGEGLQNLGLCVASTANEHEGIFIMP